MRASVALALASSLSTAAAAQATPPDLVLGHDGGMVRGTIMESVPQQYVVVALPSGETRRIPWSQVRYAGPAASAPQESSVSEPPRYGSAGALPPPASQSPPTGVRIRFESHQDGITVHRITETATAWSGHAIARGHTFARLCTAPCQMDLPPGEYHLALSAGGGTEVTAQVVVLDGPGTVSATYDDRTGLRAALWIMFVAASLGGAALAVLPVVLAGNIGGGEVAALIAGSGLGLVAFVLGLVLPGIGDAASVRFD